MKTFGTHILVIVVALIVAAAITVPADKWCAADSLTTRPRRIISLSPTITEGLYLLGLEDSLVAVTVYCHKPFRAQEKEKIGSITSPDVEKIVSLKPDLVIAMNLTDPRIIEKLKALRLNVITLRIPHSFSELCDVFLALGKCVGKEDEAIRLVQESKKQVNEISKRIRGMPKLETLVQIGSDPLYVATKNFFLNDYIEFAGGKNVFRDAGSGTVSMEEAVKRNPDVIIIATMGMSGEKEYRTWERFSTMKAVKNKRIYVVDADKLCSPTPVSFAGYLSEIVNILHPKG